MRQVGDRIRKPQSGNLGATVQLVPTLRSKSDPAYSTSIRDKTIFPYFPLATSHVAPATITFCWKYTREHYSRRKHRVSLEPLDASEAIIWGLCLALRRVRVIIQNPDQQQIIPLCGPR